MATIYFTALPVHIATALVSVVLFWIPVLARKGSRLHIRSGALYVRTMTVVSVTALILSALNLIDPVAVGTVADYQARAVLLGEELAGASEAEFVRHVRLNAVWLAYFGLMVPAGLRYGLRVVRSRHDHAELRRFTDVFIAAALLVSGVAMIALGLYVRFDLIVIFGVMGAIRGFTWGMFILRPPTTNGGWLLQHLTALLDTGLTLHIAGLLAVGRYLPGSTGQWRLLPAAFGLLGLPAIWLYRLHYRRRPHYEARQSTITTRQPIQQRDVSCVS